MKGGWAVVAVIAAALISSPAAAQTVSELLQKGIYAQETAGDLDQAIKIYKQIVTTAKDARAYAAQAQYRLGVCLLAKGDKSEAEKAFKALIENYPDQKGLVANAREQVSGDLKLLPAPWGAGDVLEMRLKMATGMPVGLFVYSAVPSGPNWDFSSRTYMTGMQWMSRVVAERDSMRPITAENTNPFLNGYRADYEGNRARITPAGKEPRTLDLEGTVFDNEEAAFLFRRLPLAEGYKATLSLVNLAGGMVKLPVAVTAVDTIEVPAGRFECYRLELDVVKQTFWISTDAHRYLVKFDATAVIAELMSARAPGAGSSSVIENEAVGYSLTAPAGWYYLDTPVPNAKNDRIVSLFDPEVKGSARLYMYVKTKAQPSNQEEVRKSIEEKIASNEAALKDYKVRPASWKFYQIGGALAGSVVADYTDNVSGPKPMVDSMILVRNDARGAIITIKAPQTDFDAFQKRIEPVLETLKLRP